MCADTIISDSFSFENTPIRLANYALQLMIGFYAVSCGYKRFSKTHVIDKIENVNTFKDFVVFK